MSKKQNQEVSALTEAVFYILLTLYQQPLHGYGIMQKIEEMSAGRVLLGAGTLYGALNSMLKKEWIANATTEKKSRKKEYVITELGKKVVTTEINRLNELINNGYMITGTPQEEDKHNENDCP